MTRTRITTVFVVGLIFLTMARVQGGEIASANDTALFLAGMQPSSDSGLARLTQERSWQQRARVCTQIIS